ncbi:MAG: hypothetical protein QNL80_00375, partial [Akkermansiaceae bacterium]
MRKRSKLSPLPTGVVASLALFGGMLLEQSAGAITPTVTFTTDAQNSPITGASAVNSGDSPTDSDIYIRERRSATQTDRRISSFLNFDVSSLTPADLSSPGFSVSFTADYDF